MPGATPIYGFPYPDPSDLVANYPALGQSLAEDVETTINTLPVPETPGLRFITSVGFSGSSAVNVNDCFSATYQSYEIILAGIGGSTGADLQFRLRVGGADATGTIYDWCQIQGNAAFSRSAGSTSFTVANMGGQINPRGTLRMNSPFDATIPTSYFSAFVINTTSTIDSRINIGSTNVNTSYTGFTIFPTSGNISGAVRVFGYRNS